MKHGKIPGKKRGQALGRRLIKRGVPDGTMMGDKDGGW